MLTWITVTPPAQIMGEILVCVCTYFGFDLPMTIPYYQPGNAGLPVRNPFATRFA